MFINEYSLDTQEKNYAIHLWILKKTTIKKNKSKKEQNEQKKHTKK